MLGNARLNHDELHTILVEIEGTLNARPLTYVSSELEGEILTPAHLLYGRNINSLPDYQGRREGGAGGALCPRASGSKGPHNWRILTFRLQEML